ncbi:hypothetical protein A3762_02145 [Oleiphilus sp. HI0125]|uniref:ComEA family DNA-binding protein n=1 Tax=Oleiphilus sp. HI0125 TaxID=1822266 RepID=UPI0007C38B82|nr:ComEA family DNA-binding protein [Oleiphilus sp. HI0125]KZZ57235.1 hypothetical protein A3762_19995 [Oleiphilus sp. HI0125]KZZ61694.1 hypothetical protein A3762_02145 [Oleiphilus sp. HI0125]
MFKIKTFISLVLASLLAVVLLHSSVAYAQEANQASETSVQAPVNINEADAQTIASNLKGIGLKKAEAIIQYRKSYGPFHDVEELKEVKGIGKSILEKNKHLIVAK